MRRQFTFLLADVLGAWQLQIRKLLERRLAVGDTAPNAPKLRPGLPLTA